MRAKFFWAALLLVAVLGIATAASASTRGLAAGKRVAPHTVSSVAGQSLGLAANSGTLVWVVARPSSASCRLSVVAIDVASGAGRQLAGATGPTCSARDLREADVRAAVGGGTALWSLGEGTTIDRQRVLSAPLRGGIVETVVGAMTHRVGSGGDYLTGLAASGSTMVYGQVTVAAVDPGCQTTAEHCLFAPTGGEVRAVSGGKSHLLSAVPAVLMAASPTLVALVEPDTSASEDPRPHTAPGGTVQVRTAATGSLITSFAPSGTVKAIAFSQGDVVVLERASDQTDRLQVWSSSSGTRLGERRVSAQSAPLLATGGSWVMRGVGDSVFGLDRDSNIGIELAQVARAPVALALVGQRIEAAINRDGSTRLEATTMRRTAGLVPVPASYNDAYQGWPTAPVDSPHGIYSGFLNPGCNCPSRYARRLSHRPKRSATNAGLHIAVNDASPDPAASPSTTRSMYYNAGLDIPVNDASPDPGAPPGTSHAIYAVEGGTVWLNSPGIHGCGGSRIRIGHFGYGHTVSDLHVGQHVDAGQRIGWTCKGDWHVHLSEFLYPRDSPRINPLRPGGRITPVTDTSPPYIDQFRFYTKKGTRLSPTSLHGVVVPVALTQDRFPYKDWPTAPVSQHVVYALAVTVHQGQTLVYSRELFKLQMAPEPLTTLFYRPLLRRNVRIADCASRRLPRCDPEYWMRLWRQGWDTRKLPAGLYRITLHVSDEAGNTATRSITVRVVH